MSTPEMIPLGYNSTTYTSNTADYHQILDISSIVYLVHRNSRSNLEGGPGVPIERDIVVAQILDVSQGMGPD